jgi:hypothetical protein
MNKNTVIGTVVGAIALQVLGFVIFAMLLADFFEVNSGSASGVAREVQVIWAQLVGAVLYAAAITLAIQAKGSAAVMDGLKAGAIVGLLIWGTADFTLYSLQNVNNLTATIVDTLLEVVRGGIVGALIALTMSKLKA